MQTITTLSLSILFYLTSIGSYSQINSFGISFGEAWDKYSYSDEGDQLIAPDLDNFNVSFIFRRNLQRDFFFESAAMIKVYWNGWRFKDSPVYTTVASDPSIIIPLRLGYYLYLKKNKIAFTPVIGYSFGLHSKFNEIMLSGRSPAGDPIGSQTIVYTSQEIQIDSRFISLFEAGAAFDFIVWKKLGISLGASYYLGTNQISEFEVSYSIDNGPTFEGTSVGKGSFYNFYATFRYQLDLEK